MTAFRDALDHCHLFDPPFHGDGYTWAKDRTTINTFKELIDYDVWPSTFQQPKISHLDYIHSDHRVISAEIFNETTTQQHKRHSRFRLKSCGYLTQTTSPLSPIVGYLIAQQTPSAMLYITWNHVRHHFSSGISRIAALKHNESVLDELLEQEEMYWQQRSRIDWMQLGDRNTKYFHSKASARRSNNKITSLKTEDGSTFTSKADMSNVIQDYFSNLFKASFIDSNTLDATLATIHVSVTMDMNATLLKPFTKEDAQLALHSMGPDKSSGIDGMSAMFYQNNWDIVGNKVTSAVLSVLNDGADPTPLNSTIITLIPKIRKAQYMKDFRPISLCSVVSKLITKILVVRFKDVLPHVISETQSTFLPNRLITDNILVAFELIHGIKLKTSGRKGVAAMKLDMSKAFDRVEWNFIKAVMERMGFADRWTLLIMTCLTTNKFTFLLNGETMGSVTPTKGLRQGCPLSPYLFLICSEGLLCLLQNEERLGNLYGILYGQELLRPSLRWKIGEGRHINCASDPWIPSHTNFIPTHYKGQPNAVVANLITEDRQWNQQLLDEYFSSIDVERILTIPLSYFSANDKLIWHHHNSGINNVHSGYHHDASLEDSDLSSTSNSPTHWWKFFWKLQLSQKIKIFVWPVFHDAIPVATSLVRRHIITDSTCTICQQAWESVGHVLFGCKYARAVWRSTNFQFHWNTAALMNKGDYLAHLSNYQHAQAKFRPQQVPAYQNSPLVPISESPWRPPDFGSLKMNVDAVVDSTNNIIGVGAVIRNCEGVVIAGFSKPLIGNFASHEMEAKAIFHSLVWATQLGLQLGHVETDAVMVTNALYGRTNCITAFNDLIIDISCLLSFLPGVSVMHVK
uniref:Reverse transcriptase domain-containing protein n=1 Tax=Cannabis sativa TaxID=3483 RepID=A0A803NJ60_CANSA